MPSASEPSGTPHRGRPLRAASAIALLLAGLALLAWARFPMRGPGRPPEPTAGTARPEAKPPAGTPADPTSLARPAESAASGLAAAPSAIADAAFQQRDNPLADGWTSEAVGSAAAAQLARLARLLSRPPTEWEAGLAELVAESWSPRPLRPAERKLAYQAKGVRVFRGEVLTGDPPRGPALTGGAAAAPAAAAEALGRLAAPLLERGPLRVEFKLYEVELAEGIASTRVYADWLAANDDGSRQLHVGWRCDWALGATGAPPRLSGITVEEFQESEFLGPGPHPWADVTADLLGSQPAFRDQLRIGVVGWAERLPTALGQDIFEQQGLAIGDADGDGRDDVYVCQPGGLPNRLFLHQPDGSVIEAAAEAGLDWLDFTRSALWVDLENDGDQDLVLAFASEVATYENVGGGRFRPAQRFATEGRPNGLAAADYDRDGLVDLYVACYGSGYAGLGGGWIPLPYFDAQNGAANYLLRNQGGLAFVDATRATGLDAGNQRWSYAAAWEDYDRDGDPDLYVANDFGRNNLYRNDDGFFVDVARSAGVEDIANGMSVSWGDFNRDGREDLYVGNMWSSAGNRITVQRQFKPDLSDADRARYQRLARGNSLFAGTQTGAFHDVSLAAHATVGRWAWSSLLVDFNNDTWLDLLVANGFITNIQTHDL